VRVLWLLCDNISLSTGELLATGRVWSEVSVLTEVMNPPVCGSYTVVLVMKFDWTLIGLSVADGEVEGSSFGGFSSL
jgi:hypothetical protein